MNSLLEWVVVLSIAVLLLFIGALAHSEGRAKQDLIYKKTGTKVSWATAIGYPDTYFTEATIEVTQ